MKNKTFLISDLHLDHANIIRYCNRPFSSAEEMNWFIVSNWNKAVGQSDIVYFLGDMAFGRKSRKTDYWLGRLNGKIIFIKGGHDRSKRIEFLLSAVLKYRGYEFLLVHDPNKAPIKWKGWIIHGHCHNNDLENYPFINGRKKTINVGVEVIDYRPLDIERLFELDFKSIERMETINSGPSRK